MARHKATRTAVVSGAGMGLSCMKLSPPRYRSLRSLCRRNFPHERSPRAALSQKSDLLFHLLRPLRAWDSVRQFEPALQGCPGESGRHPAKLFADGIPEFFIPHGPSPDEQTNATPLTRSALRVGLTLPTSRDR
jgi:hypothetical protein